MLVCQGGLAVALAGVDAVEHGQQEGAPGRFSALVRGVQEIQARLERQYGAVQLAEGGLQTLENHGSVTTAVQGLQPLIPVPAPGSAAVRRPARSGWRCVASW